MRTGVACKKSGPAVTPLHSRLILHGRRHAQRNPERLICAFVLGLACVLFLAPAGLAHDTAEIERLRRELEDARREIRALREENARLRALSGGSESVRDRGPSEQPQGTQGPLVQSAVPAKGSEPKTVPAPVPIPIEEGSLVSADQLLADCATSLRAAEARYRGRRFRVAGIAAVFAKTFTEGVWRVQLKGVDSLGAVRCDVRLPGFRELRLSSDGSLIGRRDALLWETLIRAGAEAVIEGTFAGARENAVIMKNCNLVTEQPAQ